MLASAARLRLFHCLKAPLSISRLIFLMAPGVDGMLEKPNKVEVSPRMALVTSISAPAMTPPPVTFQDPKKNFIYITRNEEYTLTIWTLFT